MVSSLHRLLTWVVSLSLVCIPAGRLLAQETPSERLEPVVVISIANADELLGDIGFLTEAAGAGDVGRLVALLAAPYTAGLQKDKPAGIYATMKGPDQIEAIGFFAVKDLDLLLGTLQDQLGQPKDVGDGVLELATDRPQSVFVKESGDWAFFANAKALLSDLPENPAQLLGDLPERYTLAARVNVVAIPTTIRDMAIQQMRKGFEQSLQKEMDDPRQAEIARKIGQRWLDAAVLLVQDSQHLTVGWQVDADAKSTHVDLTIEAAPDTRLAKDFGHVKDRRSAFSGMLRPDAAVSLSAVMPYSQTEAQQAQDLLNILRSEAFQAIEKDDELQDDQQRAQAKKIVGDLLDLAGDTVKAAKVDLGGCLILKPGEMSAALGGFVSDGERLAAILQELHAFAQAKDPGTPAVNFAAETHREVTLHTASVPLHKADQNARQALGDPMEVVIGTGKKSAYVAFGKNAKQLLKEILDASAEQREQKVAPFQASVALTPILEFAASVDDNPMLPQVLASLEKCEGRDRISLRLLPVEGGVSLRLSLDEGVLATLGQAGRALAPLMQNMRQR